MDWGGIPSDEGLLRITYLFHFHLKCTPHPLRRTLNLAWVGLKTVRLEFVQQWRRMSCTPDAQR